MITLSANRFLGALTNLIAYSQVANTTERGRVGDFVNSFQDINVENGDGKVVLASDLLNVNDLSGTSTLLSSNLPTVNEQYVSVENYKVIPMTINKYLMRGAFVEEDQLANFVGYLMSIMRTTKTAYLSEEIIKKLKSYEPTLETQKLTINTINTTGLTDPMQLNQAKQYNANVINEALIDLLNSMAFPTNAYNDLAYKEIIDYSSMKFIVRSTVNSKILVNSLASLLNSDKITEAQRWSETFVVPDEQFGDMDVKKAGWFMHNKKVQFGYFYEVATEFFDASTLNQNDWLHFAYYLDIIDAYPAVEIIIDPTITPSALGA